MFIVLSTFVSLTSNLEVEFEAAFSPCFVFSSFPPFIAIPEMLLSVVQIMIHSKCKTREIVCHMDLLWIYTSLSVSGIWFVPGVY